MANFCLIPEKINEFRKALKEKRIDLVELINMTSEARTKLLEQYAGPNAKDVNLLFEKKLVLKNRIQGIKNWAAKVGEVGRYDPAKSARLKELMEEYKKAQEERVFSPKEHQAFLEALAEEKMGVRISREEAKTVFELTSKTEQLLKEYDRQTHLWTSKESRAKYGASKVALENYVSALKDPNLSVKDMLKRFGYEFKGQFAENKPLALANALGTAVKTIMDNSIALVASVDNSFLGRQGIKTLMTHPSAWWNGARKSFTDIAKELGGGRSNDALMADVYSRPNYIDGHYDTAKLLPKFEEQYPTSLPARIPILGRLFKASEAAFTGSAIRMRVDLFDLATRMAEKGGETMSKYQVESIGKVVNSLTARGQWGKRGEAPLVRLVLWAPRMLKGNIDVLTGHLGQDISPFARKLAAQNLVKIIGTTAAIMAIANAIKPGTAELDPRSSDFGKLKFGDTRFDITGGASSLVVLAARLVSRSTKSASTGIVKQLNSGDFGSQDGFDVLVDFLSGKTNPLASTVINLLRGTDFRGEKITPGKLATGLVVPISIQNIIDSRDNLSVDRVAGILSDFLGISSSSYAPSEANWAGNMTSELEAFKEKVGDDQFAEANKKFNRIMSEWLKSVRKNPTYLKLSEDDKQKAVTKKRTETKEKIFREYGFKHKTPEQTKLPKL